MHQYCTSTGMLNVNNSDTTTILAWWPGYCLSVHVPWTCSAGDLIGVSIFDGICCLLSVPLPGIFISYCLLHPSQIHAFPLKVCTYDPCQPQGRAWSPWHWESGVAARGRGPPQWGQAPTMLVPVEAELQPENCPLLSWEPPPGVQHSVLGPQHDNGMELLEWI